MEVVKGARSRGGNREEYGTGSEVWKNKKDQGSWKTGIDGGSRRKGIEMGSKRRRREQVKIKKGQGQEGVMVKGKTERENSKKGQRVKS